MAWPVDVTALKAHLRLEPDDTDEDDVLAGNLAAAKRGLEIYLDRPLDTDPTLTTADYDLIALAVIIYAAALYWDREGTGECPAAVPALLRGLRNLAR